MSTDISELCFYCICKISFPKKYDLRVARFKSHGEQITVQSAPLWDYQYSGACDEFVVKFVNLSAVSGLQSLHKTPDVNLLRHKIYQMANDPRLADALPQFVIQPA